jgi:nitrile hydratase accessory protein
MNDTQAPLLPAQPQDKDGPVFREAWEAQVFAMGLTLHKRGVFTWQEWTNTLGDEIKAAQASGDPDLGTTYYRHCLKALERLIIAKGVATEGLIQDTTDAWSAAALATPHGKPIVLTRPSAS